MGDMADYYIDEAIADEMNVKERVKDFYKSYEDGRLIWTTKKGDEILVTDMSKKHLQNSINMLIRNNESDMGDTRDREAVIEILKRELKNRK